jgi:hypothetical protein
LAAGSAHCMSKLSEARLRAALLRSAGSQDQILAELA